jgi:hypothetical protein
MMKTQAAYWAALDLPFCDQKPPQLRWTFRIPSLNLQYLLFFPFFHKVAVFTGSASTLLQASFAVNTGTDLIHFR